MQILFFLQETHLVNADAEYIKKLWKGEFHLSGFSKNSKGLLTLFGENIPHENIKNIDKSDRIITSSLSNIGQNGLNLILVNVYAPNESNEKMNFLKSLTCHLRKIKSNLPDHSIVNAGDFNTVYDNELDIISGNIHNQNNIDCFKKLINENILTDSWRHLNRDKKMHSWRRGKIARRLDYILIENNLIQFLKQALIESIGFSDHMLVTSIFQFNNFKFGKSYYKMNVSLLEDKIFLSLMKDKIPFFIEQYKNLDPQLQWEMTKIEIREFSQKYSKAKSFERGREKLELKRELNDIEQKIVFLPFDDNLLKRQQYLKGKWEEIILEESKGRQIRSGTKWIEEGEKNSKFFLGLEKSRALNNTIFELNVEGNSIEGESDILNELGKFYEKLYKKEEVVSNKVEDDFLKFLFDLVIPSLSEDSRKECDEIISLEEMGEAILKMNNGATPGSDGLPIEFYKFFYKEIKHILFNCFLYSFETSTLPKSQQKGIISLLHKANNLDRKSLENWRPLSLTNADYKILAKMLASRIQKIITEIIHSDQCGFIKGRDISNLLRQVDDLLENNKNETNEHIILAIDYRKAFDTVRTDFIIKCLNLFGFGAYIIQWINILLLNRTFCIKNGGHISKDYKMERGVRQGCPLSPLLFIISIELLGISVRQSENIKGITIRVRHFPVTHKIKQYADDTTFILNGLIDFREVLSKIKEFSNISGLYLNKNKTYAMRIGESAVKIKDFQGVKFVDRIKLLGIYFSNSNAARDIEDNWIGRIERLEQKLSLWARRKLTLLGKVTVIKTFGLSQFIYVMKSIGLKKEVLQRINKIIFSFLWGKDFKSGRTFEKIKRSILCREIANGGLSMIDIEDMQKTFLTKWALKFIIQRTENWTAVPMRLLKSVGGEKAFFSNIGEKQFKGIESIKSFFWREVLKNWLHHNENGKMLDVKLLKFEENTIFNNNEIKYKGKVLYLEEIIKKGIISVKDFLQNGKLISYEEFLYKIGRYPSADLDYNVIFNALELSNIKKEGMSSSDLIESAKVICCSSNKVVRNMIREDDNNQSIGQQFWNRKFEQDIMNKYISAINSTKEIKLKEIMFKIFHNIYPTNFMLQKMKITDSNNCKYCGEIDYTEHFFVTCPRLTTFWIAVLEWIEKEIGIKISSGITEKLFGISVEDNINYKGKKTVFVNHILIIAKFSIIKAKYLECHNIFEVFLNESSKRRKYFSN